MQRLVQTLFKLDGVCLHVSVPIRQVQFPCLDTPNVASVKGFQLYERFLFIFVKLMEKRITDNNSLRSSTAQTLTEVTKMAAGSYRLLYVTINPTCAPHRKTAYDKNNSEKLSNGRFSGTTVEVGLRFLPTRRYVF